MCIQIKIHTGEPSVKDSVRFRGSERGGIMNTNTLLYITNKMRLESFKTSQRVQDKLQLLLVNIVEVQWQIRFAASHTRGPR